MVSASIQKISLLPPNDTGTELMKLIVHSERIIQTGELAVALLAKQADGTTGLAMPLVFHQLADGHRIEPSEYTLNGRGEWEPVGREFLQAVLDHAWAIGMRPIGYHGSGSPEIVKAMNDHLQDMRKLVFDAKV